MSLSFTCERKKLVQEDTLQCYDSSGTCIGVVCSWCQYHRHIQASSDVALL